MVKCYKQEDKIYYGTKKSKNTNLHNGIGYTRNKP